MTKWTINLFINVIVTMIAIYFVKTVSLKYDVPFMRDVAKTI